MLPPQKERKVDELFAKQIIDMLGKQPEVSDKVANRLAMARNAALSKMKETKKETLFNILLNKAKDVFSVQTFAGMTAVATVCFAVFGFIIMDQENQLIFDDNISVISAHFEDADNINGEVEDNLTEEDMSI